MVSTRHVQWDIAGRLQTLPVNLGLREARRHRFVLFALASMSNNLLNFYDELHGWVRYAS